MDKKRGGKKPAQLIKLYFFKTHKKMSQIHPLQRLMFSQMQRAEKWHCIAKEEIEKGKHLTLEALQEHQEEQVKDMIKERAILAIK